MRFEIDLKKKKTLYAKTCAVSFHMFHGSAAPLSGLNALLHWEKKLGMESSIENIINQKPSICSI